ncbi:MAG: MotA/TolQ/ExbB proton channel family protein [Halioglobus sp.]
MMLSNEVESLIRLSGATQLTEYFLYVLLVVFVMSLWWKRSEKHSAFTNYAPTLLTSIGILGTFTGIISGLLDFNPDDIDNSIGPLLNGLKTAFITSLAGMLLSIVYKAIAVSGFMKKKDAEIISEDEVGAVDIYKAMMLQVEGIDALKKSISENDESSLVGQVKLLRSDVSDNQKITATHLELMALAVTNLNELSTKQHENFKQFEDRLWIKLQDFADMMSKSATEQVIEALKQVIVDFNNNLVEQFGENFKQLNEAVFRLLEWQENYKHQLEDMKHKYDLGVQAITQTESSIAHISEEAKVIPIAMNELKQVVEVNQHQITELDRHLGAFAEVRDKAVSAVPEIRDQIDQAVKGAKAANDVLATGMQESADRMGEMLLEGSEQFKESVTQSNAAMIEASQTTANSSEQIRDQFATTLEDINNNMRNLITELQNGGEELKTSYQDASRVLMDESKESSRAFADGMGVMRQNLEQSITEHATEHRRQADQIFAGLEASIAEALSSTGESVQKQVEMIDKTAGEEIQKVMTSMGGALASISGQFTSDYQKLVNQMRAIVRDAV